MRRTGGDSSFGAPKPLAGQAGYKMSESERLAKEAKEMEARLSILQDKVKTQQLDTATISGSGKWKSSSTEKGSIRAYGKEVTDKFKKRIVNEGGVIPSVTGTMKTTSRQSSFDGDLKLAGTSSGSQGNFTTKEAESWSIEDVCEWLTFMKLDQYVKTFSDNQISGSILLDLTLEDLDYLEITVLAHRKTLLRGINDLKQSSAGKKSAQGDRLVASSLQRSQSANKMVEGEKQILSKSVEIKKTHWSQLEPLSSKEVKGGGVMVNPADKSRPDDIFDEETERMLFQDAVKEWRQSSGETQKKITIVREYEKGKNSAGTVVEKKDLAAATNGNNNNNADDDNNWQNPFGGKQGNPNDVFDEEAERAAFQEAVKEWRSGGAAKNEKLEIVREYKEKPKPKKSSPVRNQKEESVDEGMWKNPFADLPPKPKTPSLLVGELNEEQEHAEFVKAVEAWRGGKGRPTTADKNKVVADSLAKQLDTEQREFLQKIEHQKKEAERKLYMANLELEKIRKTKLENIQSEEYNPDDETNLLNEYEEIVSKSMNPPAKKSSSSKASASSNKPAVSPRAEPFTYVKKPVATSRVSYDDSDEEGNNSQKKNYNNNRPPSSKKDEDQAPYSPTVRISLVESILASPKESAASETIEEGFCVVEYESDEN